MSSPAADAEGPPRRAGTGDARSTPLVKAMVVIRRASDGALLVQRDTAHPKPFERLLGGHVEFGERAEAAAQRELREEIGREIRLVRRLGVIENLFVSEGVAGHEVVFVFEAEFVDPAAGELVEVAMCDQPSVIVHWRPAAATEPVLYPEGLAELLERD